MVATRWLHLAAAAVLAGLLGEWARRAWRRAQEERRRAREEQERQAVRTALLDRDLGEAHPLWQPLNLCPTADGTSHKLVRYPGLSFCPPLKTEPARQKLTMYVNPREYNGDKRVAWNSDFPDWRAVRDEYWVLDAAAVVAVLGVNTRLSKWVVNLGAAPSAVAPNALREHSVGDDVAMLWPMGFGGLCFDLPENWKSMSEFYAKWPKVTTDFQAATPDSFMDRVHHFRVPKDLDVVKIDVDSFDCEFLEAFLGAGYRPKLITMELGSSFPPPLRFKARSKGFPFIATRFTPLQGCSLQYAVDFLRPLGYVLLQYVVEDAWFVLGEYAHLFGRFVNATSEAYALGNPFMTGKWSWPEFQWSLYDKRHDPEAMLVQARNGVQAMMHLRPGLEALQYVLELGGPD